MELIIGSHVSFNKNEQLLGSVNETINYGANTFMFYTGAPQNTQRVPINDKLTMEAKTLMTKNGIDINNVIIHAPYIINLANPKNFDFNVRFLKEEISRAESLGISKIVIHPGSHVGLGVSLGIKNIIDSLNLVINKNTKVIICLETMAGKGSEIGRNFDEIRQIIDGIDLKDKIGVCMDTCHLNDAGYDLKDFNSVLLDFDKIVGLKYLKVIHINDSKNEINTHKDRHENIGFGTLGFDTLINIIYNDKIKEIPKILETPYVGVNPPYKYEISMIKNKKFNPDLINQLSK